jgi:ribonuclease HII
MHYCRENGLICHHPVAGIDEVGRGPLVGAVIAAAVILPEAHGIEGLNDSKKLSEKKREVVAQRIREIAIAWAIGRAEPEEIDQLNILQASLLAMTRAVTALHIEPACALVDGNKKPALPFPCITVVKGDSRVEEIAAASIVAKVFRDDEMYQLDAYYPQYGFAQHKGYPTALHLEKIQEYGVIPLHRKSFAPVRKIIEQTKS